MPPKTAAPDAAKPPNRSRAPEPTAVEKHQSRKAVDAAPRLKVTSKAITLDCEDRAVGEALLMEALGTADEDFANGLLGQLADIYTQDGQFDESNLNFLLSAVEGVRARDQIEAMLAAQMVAVHVASMKLARRLERAETIPEQDSAERAFNKLTRTYATQMEALKRYRSGGEQKVTVHHVSVSEGGQAIVGNVTQAARQNEWQESAAAPAAPPGARRRPTAEPTHMPIPAAVPFRRRQRE